MPSRSAGRAARLWRKEFAELSQSPSFLLLLVLVSLLVGHEFVASVETFAELSGPAGAPSALARGMNPLDGILVPTFGAYDIAAMLLLPFVVIRVFSYERATGAWTLLVQSPASVRSMVAIKAGALGVAWLIAMLPGAAAVALWVSYGGHVNGAELATLVAGHVLRAGLTVAIAAPAAAITRQAASAAIIALGATIGTWALDFAAATRGGAWASVAAFTPGASLRFFEQGLVRVNTVVVMIAACVAGLTIAGAWLASGLDVRRRVIRSVSVLAGFVVIATLASRVSMSWDVSEDRRHSFSEADEAALASLKAPLRVEVHLGAEDPRLADYRREILDKLARAVPRLDVAYVGAGGTGLLAHPDSQYGEVWYAMAGKRVMLRSAIEPLVLEAVYGIAGLPNIPAPEADAYPGYPLRHDPRFAGIILFLTFPVIYLTSFLMVRRK